MINKRPEHWIRQLYSYHCKREISFDRLVAHIGPASAFIEHLDIDDEIAEECYCNGETYRHHDLDYMIRNELALKQAHG